MNCLRIASACFCIAGLIACNNPFHADFAAIGKSAVPVPRQPSVRPDYSGATIPPNIGPLNFIVSDSGSAFCVRISAVNGKPISLFSKKPEIRIPLKQWAALLSQNPGETLKVDVLSQRPDKTWRAYATIQNPISKDRIDSYIMYRTLSVLYTYSRDLCLFQRNLETNTETEMLNALNFFPGCCSCHTLLNNDPSNAFFHIRTQDFGNSALIVTKGSVEKIGTKFGYTSWHPSGKLAVYSVNKVDQCFHAAWKDLRDAFDLTSGLKVYMVEKHSIRTVPQIFRETALETWPCWSPDGKFLYFSSAPLLWNDFKTIPPDNLDKVRYSLMRISYDETRDAWGEVDTVLSANQTSASITQPRISPDGKFVVFCRHEYGPSPYLQKTSDLFIMNLGTGHVEPLAINSEWSESWHSWSSNGRWIAFSSKRDGGILGRIYLCHIDSSGKAAKAFIMPQSDPGFYDSFIKVYNIPEFATSRFTVRQQDLVSAIRSSKKLDVNVPAVTGATPAIQRKAE